MRGFMRIFAVEGLNLERLLRIAGERGIAITGVRRATGRRVTGLVRESELPLLATLAKEGGWRLESGERAGAGHAVDLMRKRWLLTAGVVLAFALILACTQVMWRIEIVDAGAYEADLRIALAEMGVRTPMLREQVEPSVIRDALEWRYPRVAWIECGWRGMTLVIRVVEGVLPQSDGASDGSCDVVAARDGVVSSIVTRAGTPVVAVGDVVRKGQVMIRGEERTSGGEVRPVAARGSVMARVWDGVSVQMSLYETQTIYTGRTQTVWTVASPWFDLWPVEESGYAQQDTAVTELPLGGFFIPLTLRTETRMEAECTRQLRDRDALYEDCARAATLRLYEKVGGKESLVDNWVNWSIIEDEILLSAAIGERIVDIAQQERDSVMAAAE